MLGNFARRLAVIGTAGRDKTQHMTRGLWQAMKADLQGRLKSGDTLVSGGAAWADHLAVQAYLDDWCEDLKLFLPALFIGGRFFGVDKSVALGTLRESTQMGRA